MSGGSRSRPRRLASNTWVYVAATQPPWYGSSRRCMVVPHPLWSIRVIRQIVSSSERTPRSMAQRCSRPETLWLEMRVSLRECDTLYNASREKRHLDIWGQCGSRSTCKQSKSYTVCWSVNETLFHRKTSNIALSSTCTDVLADLESNCMHVSEHHFHEMPHTFYAVKG